MSAPPVVIGFQVGGLQDVLRAFRSVESSVVTLARKAAQSSVEQERALKRQATEQSKVDKTMVREKEKSLREIDRATKMSAKEQEKVAKQTAREQTKAANDAVKERLRIEREGGRQLLQASQALTKNLLKEEKQRQHDIERVQKDSQRTRQQLGRFMGKSVGNAVSRTASLGGLALGVAGGFSMSDVIQSDIHNRGKAFDISLSRSAGKNVSKEDVYSKAGAAATAFGFSRDSALTGLESFTSKTGNVGMGTEALRGLAEVARATNSNLQDVAAAAGDIFSSDTTMSAEKLVSLVGGIAIQGRNGKVEMRDLATQMTKITAGAGLFGGDSSKNVLMMGAFAQMAAGADGGAPSADEAATSAQRFGSDIASHADKFAAAGIKVKNGEVLRNADDILIDSLKWSGGDVTKYRDLGFGERSIKTVDGAAKIFRGAGGGKAGEDAVRAELERLTNVEKHAATLKKDAADRMKSLDLRLATVMENFRNKLAEKLTPTLERLAPKMEALVPHVVTLMEKFGEFVEWFANNPLTGIGIIIAAQVTRDVASASIGTVIAKIITAAAGGVTSGGVGYTGAIGGVTGLKGAGVGLGILGVVAGGAAIMQDRIDVDSAERNALTSAGAGGVASGSSAISNLYAGMRNGKVDEGSIQAAQDKLAELRELERKQMANAENPNVGEAFGGMLTKVGGVFSDDLKQAGKTNEAAKLGAITDTQETIRDLNIALQQVTVGMSVLAERTKDVKRSEPMASAERK